MHYLMLCVSLVFMIVPERAFAADPQQATVELQTPEPGAVLALERAIRIALHNHPLIERAQYAALGARAVTKQTRGERYPWLEASVAGGSGSFRIVSADGRTIHDQGAHGFDPGGSLPKHNQNMLTGGLILNQLISDFGYTAHRILMNEKYEGVSDKELFAHKAQVILNVQRAYFAALMHQRLVELATATLQARQAFRDRVAVLYRNQLKSKVDLDLLQVEVSNAEFALLGQKNNVKQQFGALNNAMGLSAAREYLLEPMTAVVQKLPALDTLVSQGLEARPELLGARDKSQASAELLKAVKALNYGSISAVGVIGATRYFDVHEAGIHDDQLAPMWGGGATIRFPLFTGFKVQNQIAEALHQQGETEQDLQQTLNEVTFQVIRAYFAQVSNGEQIPVEQERVNVAREALSLAQERYKMGLTSIVEVIQSTTLLFQAESRLAELQFVYRLGDAALGYAIGQTYQRY